MEDRSGRTGDPGNDEGGTPAVAEGAGGTGTALGKRTGGDPAVTSKGEIHSTGRYGEGGSNLSKPGEYPRSGYYDYGSDSNPALPRVQEAPKEPITPRVVPNDRPGRP